MNASGFAANMLQEGWATFAEGIVLGDVYGADAERAFWERQRTGYMTGLDRSGFLGGFEGKQSILGNPDNGRIHYFKGSWVLRSLDRVLGDSTFDRGMREYIALRVKGLPAGHREFIAAMSHAAKRDLTGFVMPWLEGKYIPDVEARVEGTRVVVTQNQPDLVFDLPLELALATQSGDTVRRSIHLTRRADTLDVRGVGVVTGVRVDPDHWFLLKRHDGELVRFELAASAVPDAKVVELTGNFLAKPVPATRAGDVWVVELPMSEGRYIWQWRVDGSVSNDEAAIVAAATSSPTARTGIRVVRPLRRLDESYPR
jgi:aminopeptidase N